MRAGKLRTQVVIESATVTYNALNESTNTWATLLTRPGEVVADGGREYVAAKQVVAELTDLVKLRYTPSITAKMRAKIGVRLLDIRAVVDLEEKHEQTWLYCVERVA